MRVFNSGNLSIVCNTKNTRSGFKHVASVTHPDFQHEVKINYYNRTWESYEYQSVLNKLAEKIKKSLSEKEYQLLKKNIKNKWREEETERVNKEFGSVMMVAALGDIFADNKSDKNKWKERMIKAGLPVQFPDDWDTLSEDEKERRLNNLINIKL